MSRKAKEAERRQLAKEYDRRSGAPPPNEPCNVRVWEEGGRAYFGCDGNSDHAPFRVDFTQAIVADLELRRRGEAVPPQPKDKLLDHAILTVITAYWKPSLAAGNPGLEVKTMLELFPGLGEGKLNSILMRLVTAGKIAVGTCGCCFMPLSAIQPPAREQR